MTAEELPELERIARRREYDNATLAQRRQVVVGWLFEGLTHRQLDETYLGLDRDVSHGYQSMGILHFIGLKGGTRALSENTGYEKALELMRSRPDYDAVVAHLEWSDAMVPLEQFEADENREIEKARKMSGSARRSALRRTESPEKPERVRVVSYVYKRNPLVILEALERAKGVCEKCRKPAPFQRASDGSPFLEIHYTIPLRSGGPDSVDNVLALCPNCHRFEHHGRGLRSGASCGAAV
jgi:5-methylcytosine-specific restriction protein A